MKGKITFITGKMHAGKSSALLKHIEASDKRAMIAVPYFNEGKAKFRARRKDKKAITLEAFNFVDIAHLIHFDVEEMFIDEIQFARGDVEDLISIKEKGVHIIVGGLMSEEGTVWENSDKLKEIADEVIVLEDYCPMCQSVKPTKTVLVDGRHTAICESCREKVC